MKNYTVILTRPAWARQVTETAYGQDVYFAHVGAATIHEAVAAARKQVMEVDAKGTLHLHETDYILTAVLGGHVTPVLFGWQE